MQRIKEKIEVEEEVKATFGYEGDVDLSGETKPPVEIWQTEASYGPCEDLRFGRMSFKNYNPEIEVLMAEKSSDKAKKGKKDEDTFDEMSVDINESTKSGGKKRKRHRYVRPVD